MSGAEFRSAAKAAMTSDASPFDSIRDLIAMMPPASEAAVAAVAARDSATDQAAGRARPARGNRRIPRRLAGQGRADDRSAAGRDLRRQSRRRRPGACRPIRPRSPAPMLENFAAGGAAINQICATYGARPEGLRTRARHADARTSPRRRRWRRPRRRRPSPIGMEAIAGGVDLLCVGEMGIGNTTVAAAIYHGALRRRGRGLGRARNRRRRRGPHAQDRGGRGGGRAASAASRRSARTAAPARRARDRRPWPARSCRGAHAATSRWCSTAMSSARPPPSSTRSIPRALDHCLAGHVSAEGAHAEVLRRLGKKPLLDLGMRLGEGSGAPRRSQGGARLPQGHGDFREPKPRTRPRHGEAASPQRSK